MPRKSMVSESTCTRTYLPDASHFSRGEPLREATERCATRQPQRNCRFGSVGERLPAGARPAQRTGAFRTANPRGQPRSSAACRGSKFPWKLPRARPPPAHTQRHGHAGAAAKTVWLRDSLLVLNSECATTAAGGGAGIVARRQSCERDGPHPVAVRCSAPRSYPNRQRRFGCVISVTQS
jgi:hypothetical protein